ncbi:WYL domain-containing protein [Luteolibacter luteus]|uniref:WYL domain-containing protein n=1 Tax=Luteolibacter luteus TaxID=2728835 RepID=UPI003CCCDC95
MGELQEAISKRRLIRFLHKAADKTAVSLVAEPHCIDHAPRTGALVLLAWMRSEDGGEDPGWKTIRFCEIRDLMILPEPFVRRPFPEFAARCFDPSLALRKRPSRPA